MADTTAQEEQAPLEQLPPDEPSGDADDAAGGSNNTSSVTEGDISAVRSHASKLLKKAKN